MHYFLDTCVELGYVFCTDPWNDKSVKVLMIMIIYIIRIVLTGNSTKNTKDF